ncbi:helix-turn-helix domain-containing protein [Soehngenia saccharolytica]|nr:helix-turn-helix domain-containing protein [Soehngenia saccharolytica]
MNYYYEPINKDEKIPIKIFTQTLEQFPFHWHDEAEIIFVLKGKCSIYIDNNVTELIKGDIFIINSREIHQLKSSDEPKCELLVFQFNLDYFEDKHKGINNLTFKVDINKDNNDIIDRIKSFLAMIMDQTLKHGEYYELRIELLFTELILLLVDNFAVRNNTNSASINNDSEKVFEIIEFIKDNIDNQNLTIKLIAEKFHYNSQYLSKYFKKSTGIPIKKYIENLRVSRSINDLKYTDLKIVDLALKNGFPDTKSYYRAFKNSMGITPNEFRNEHKVDISYMDFKNYFSINTEELLSELFLYLDNSKPIITSADTATKEVNILLDLNQVNVELPTLQKPWENLITIGYSVEGLRKDQLDIIEKVQKDIGFKYIRFHGIFSDFLSIYNEDSLGKTFYDYNDLDLLIDSLMELNIKPFIELTFIPTKLTQNGNTIFKWKDSISKPSDINKWNDLIDNFIRHIIDRYGIDEVKDWYFEVWNEPEIEGVFWDGSKEEFFEFFVSTYQTIKNISKDLKVGGVGNMSFLLFLDWLDKFYQYINEKDVKLDFYSFHVYSVELVESITEISKLKEKIDVNDYEAVKYKAKLGDENKVSDYITLSIDRVQKLHNFTKEEYWITEFNSSTISRDLIHDTVYMSSFLVKNYLENLEKVKGIGYWTLTDLNNEFEIEKALFYGGFGLFTYNGIPKASYNAYKLLHELKGNILEKNSNYIVLKDKDDVYLMFHNYIHYDAQYENLDFSKINLLDRYSIFDEYNTKFNINLNGLSGNYKVEQYIVNREHGSSFDAWVEMGYPKYPSLVQIEYLKSRSVPKILYEEMELADKFDETFVLLPHEIRLVKLIKLYK